MVLQKGDKVVIHTHRLATKYEGVVFTCLTNERAWGDEMGYVIMEGNGIGMSFFTEYLEKVEDEANKLKFARIQAYSPIHRSKI